MDRVPPDVALEHARTVREAMTEEQKQKTGDTLYPPVETEPEEATHHPHPPDPDSRDRLVPDPGDVKAATANPKFGETGATPPEATTSHAVASAGDVHAPTGNKAME